MPIGRIGKRGRGKESELYIKSCFVCVSKEGGFKTIERERNWGV